MRYLGMITAIFGMIFLAQCSNAQKKENETMEHKNNPYYSRTDTTHLNVSDEEWKKILPKEVYNNPRR